MPPVRYHACRAARSVQALRVARVSRVRVPRLGTRARGEGDRAARVAGAAAGRTSASLRRVVHAGDGRLHFPTLALMAKTEERQELWGGETTKAVANFPVSGEPIPAPVARWLGRIKGAAARANADLGLLDADKAERISLVGTATGTGLNTRPGFAACVRELLARETGLEISAPADPFEAQAARDGIVEASGALKTLAVSLTKIANDIRFLGSGPRAGLAEIALPELQKGSSIMPGKVNPVMPEVVTQVAAQVIGNDTAITIGGMQGHFELNVFVPLLARNILDSVKLLASACRLFAEKCVDGIEANRENCERYAELTLSAATALNPYIGYDRASEIVKEAAASGRSLREVAREKGVEESILDEALDYRKMAKPHN